MIWNTSLVVQKVAENFEVSHRFQGEVHAKFVRDPSST